MDKNMSKKEFGGWKRHGDDVSEPAREAQKHFKYDLNYIIKRLKWATPQAATKPANVSADEWAERKQAVDEWCEAVMSGGLWWDGMKTKQAVIGDRVYQMTEGDKKKGEVFFTSYLYEARKKAIHPFQFRAPGEWFAELYAAYYMGVLKPDHPAVKDWLPNKLKK